MQRLLALVVCAAVLTVPAPAGAHQASTSYLEVRLHDSGALEARLRLSTRDLYEALALPQDRDATDEEIRTGSERLLGYVLARIDVRAGDGKPCPTRDPAVDVAAEGGVRLAQLSWKAECPPANKVIIDYRLFFDLDPQHTAFLLVRHGERTVTRELQRGLSTFEWDLRRGAPESLGVVDYVTSGVEHIFTGYDHIAFVLGLLLVGAIRRRDEAWEPRGMGAGIRYVAATITGFTAGHSVTLVAAGLDWFSLPGRLVESAIAASIVYVAVENLLVGDPPRRWLLALAFGLVHGVGFASMLRPLLPPSGIVVPLLAFNVGVELGQLAIVLLLYPVLHVVATRGADRYRRAVVGVGSGIIGVLGLVWLVERVFDVDVLPFL